MSEYLVSYILKSYLFLAISVSVHEICHCLAAGIIRIPIHRVSLGLGIYIEIPLRRTGAGTCLSLSPFLFGGYVEAEKEALFKKKPVAVFLFVLSGSMGNLAVLLFFLIFAETESGIRTLICLYNLTAIAISLFPAGTENDYCILREYFQFEN